MHSANWLTGCTGPVALPASEGHPSWVTNGTTRSALGALWRGIVFIAVLASLIRAAIGRQLSARSQTINCSAEMRATTRVAPKISNAALDLSPPGPNPSPPNPLSHRERGRKTKKTGLTQRHEGTEKNSQPRAVQTQIQTGILATRTHDRPEVELGFLPCHSAHLRKPGVPGGLVGHPIPICTTEAIHGKTGSAPSGALLFRPFSWAMQEKGQGNRGR